MLDYNEINRVANNFAQHNENARRSLLGYAEAMAEVQSLQTKINRGRKEASKIEKKIADLERKKISQNGQLSRQDQIRLEAHKKLLQSVQQLTEEYEMQAELNNKNLSVTNLITAGVKTMGLGLSFVGKNLKANSQYWFDQMRAIRTTEKSMGILSNQVDAFRNHLETTAFYTSDILVDAKSLAEIQGAYSNELGKNVILTQNQLETMAAMSKVLGMSYEETGRLGAEWENIGSNTDASMESIERLTLKTRKAGLNTVKVLGQMKDIMKKANMYGFKNGINGMEKMAMQAEKYKMSMDTISGFSDKLFDVEGAIEMSANLQVLGGKWAQISDPMQLMFKARNDMEGLQNDVIKAASETADWDPITKDFKISSLQLHRMRGAAEMTGMSLEQLRDTAIATAKVSRINMEIGGKIKDPKIVDWITNTAQLNKDTGKFQVFIDGKNIDVDKLGNNVKALKKAMNDERTLKEIEQQSLTFDQRVDALIMKAKTAFLPLVESFDKAMQPFFLTLTDYINKHGKDIIGGIGKVGSVLLDLSKWVIENPIKTLLIGGLAGVGKLFFEYQQWVMNGKALAMGFNMANNMNGMANGRNGMAGGLSDMVSGMGSRGARAGRGKYFMRGAGKMLKGGGLASILGMVGDTGLDMAADGGLIDPNGNGYKLGKIGASAATWGGTGAMIGSIIPGVGTAIGAGIGALGGAGYEAFNQYFSGAKQHQDFISRPGADPISFSSADTLVGLKKDGGLGKALLNNAGVGSSTQAGISSISFTNSLKIEGNIKITSPNGQVGSINLDDPILRREITRMVQEQLSTNLAGGVRTVSKL